jgi:hypothetical protein
MLTKSFAAALAFATLALAMGCSPGDEPGDRKPSASETQASTMHLVVLGDSNAHPSSCSYCTTFGDLVAHAMTEKLNAEVLVENLAWKITNPHPAEMKDLVTFARTDDNARSALADADAVLILASQNDLAYNRYDDPCDVAPDYPKIHWRQLTHTCMDRSLDTYERRLNALLSEIGTLRDGRPTMLRYVSAINTTLGDLVDPTWNSPAAVEPSYYNVSRMVDVQCRVAQEHGGVCADVFHVLNGATGRRSAQSYLNAYDATHLTQRGHDAVAQAIVETGFAPLGVG